MSVTMTKVQRVLQNEGLLAVPRAVVSHSVNAVRAARFVRSKPTFHSLDDLIREPVRAAGRVIKAMQIHSEIRSLLELVQARRPQRVLEIGTQNGGTLFLWTRVAAPNARIVSIDLPGGKFGDGYAAWRAPLYRAFALPGQTVELIRADSHHGATFEEAKVRLEGPADFVFIDGDHSYSGVRQDFELYKMLVARGGLIAFHDIAPPRAGAPDDGHKAHIFWQHLKADPTFQHARKWEFIDSPNQHLYGIGVIELP